MRPINVPIYMAGQGPKARALAREIADGLIALGGPVEGFESCLVSANGTVLDDGEEAFSARASTARLSRSSRLPITIGGSTDPDSVKGLPNGEGVAGECVECVDEKVRHLVRSPRHNLDVSNGHDGLVDVSNAKQMTFTGTREELRERLAQFEARGATGVIFGTTGYDVERELEGLRGGRGIEVIGARWMLVTGGLALRAMKSHFEWAGERGTCLLQTRPFSTQVGHTSVWWAVSGADVQRRPVPTATRPCRPSGQLG